MSTHPLHVKTDWCVIPMLSLALQSLLSHSCAMYWFWWKQLANPNKHVSEPFKLTEILAQHDPLAGLAQGLPELLTWQGVAVEGGGRCVWVCMRGMLLRECQTSSSSIFHLIYAQRFNDCRAIRNANGPGPVWKTLGITPLLHRHESLSFSCVLSLAN